MTPKEKCALGLLYQHYFLLDRLLRKLCELDQMLKFQPSSRSLLIERVVSGHYWTMMKLGVNTAFRPNLERALEATPDR